MEPKGADEYAGFAELYDHVVPYKERTDVAFYVDAAKSAGGPVLEIGCGTGRVLIPCARAGAEMVGLDLSASMLAACRDRLAQEEPAVRSRVELVQADMCDFYLGRTFPLVTIPFRPFQHLLSVQDQLACLASVRRHLADAGRLVFDLFNPSLDALVTFAGGEEFGEEPQFVMPDGRRVVRRSRIAAQDRFNQVNQVELVYYVTYPDGRTERRVDAFQMRYLFRFEAEHLLVRAGFEVDQLFGDFDKRPFGSTYPGEMIFVARKTK